LAERSGVLVEHKHLPDVGTTGVWWNTCVPPEPEAFNPHLQSPVHELHDDRMAVRGVRLYVKRDDLIHPEVPGNKWRKLKYNLERAKRQGHSTLLTFGGAYSNHVRATAAVGNYFGFSTIGVIRGEEHLPLNSTLRHAVSRGMKLIYMDRTTYRRKADPNVICALRDRHGSFYLLPEGGTNELAVRGCAELPREIDHFDVICCPCGTGGTLAGIAAGLSSGQQALGFAVLKGGQFLANEVMQLHQQTYGKTYDNWSIEFDFHFGGFAKSKPELESFIADFEHRHRLSLDRTYVAKMMYGIFALVERGEFPPGTIIVAVITGSADGDSNL
jgi:1-aminocyclopropane-1-carboxylate deaminase